jgi:hypothetical protein
MAATSRIALNVFLPIVPLLFTESQVVGLSVRQSHRDYAANIIPLYSSRTAQVNRRGGESTARPGLLAKKSRPYRLRRKSCKKQADGA